MASELDYVIQLVNKSRMDILDAITKLKIAPEQVNVLALSDLSKFLGLIRAGEFRTGNQSEPGSGFTGVRIAYPPLIYSAREWNIVGVDNDVIQFGLNADDGTAWAGGGAIRMTASGLLVYNDVTNTGAIQSDGDVFLGSDISAAGTTSFCMFAVAQTYNSESVGAGDILIGDNSSGKPNLFWDSSAGELHLRSGTTIMNKMTSGSLRFLTAMATRVATQSISDATNTWVQFDTEHRDDSTYIALGTDNTKVTIPTGLGGDYMVSFAHAWAPSGGGSGYRHALVNINGSPQLGDSRSIASAGGYTGGMGSMILTLAAGDYLQLDVYQSSGGSLDLTGAWVQIVKMS